MRGVRKWPDASSNYPNEFLSDRRGPPKIQDNCVQLTKEEHDKDNNNS